MTINPSYMMQALVDEHRNTLIEAGARGQARQRECTGEAAKAANAAKAAKVAAPRRFGRAAVVARVRHALVSGHG